MNPQELIAILDRDDAADSLYALIREGLTNAVAIPEVETEADQSAHLLLGCVNYMALLSVYATADDMRPDEPIVAGVISDMADNHLRALVLAMIRLRGPVGSHNCDKGTRNG